MGCEAKLGSKRGTHAIGTPTRQEQSGAKRGRPVNCAIKISCTATIKAGGVEPYGNVCQTETRKGCREEHDRLAAKPGRRSVSLDRRGRGAEN